MGLASGICVFTTKIASVSYFDIISSAGLFENI